MDKELPASVWPEWKIIEKIGEGSFGRVYKAERTEQGRPFYSAIKIITIPETFHGAYFLNTFIHKILKVFPY